MKTTCRIATLALILALFATAPGACSPQTPAAPTAPPSGTPESAFPVTIVDDAQIELTIEAEPERIISLVPSMTETLFALGLGDRVVGVTTYCDYPEEAKSKEKIGEFATIDLERVVSLNPDLVLATSLHYQDVAPALRERGFTVAVLEAENVEGVLAEILTIGRMTGRLPEAQALVEDIQAHLDEVAAKVAGAERPRVFWELDAMLYSVGKDSIIDDVITRAGGDNIGRLVEGEWPQFSMEALVEADPEVIVLADHDFGETAETVRARAGWTGITAVREGRIVEVEDVNIVSRPGPRIAEAVEYIARELHPEVFEGN